MLALIGAIRGTSKEQFYEKLGVESLQHRRWYRKLSFFYKLSKNGFPQYLFELIGLRSSEYSTRCTQNVPFFKARHIYFFLSAIRQYIILDLNIRNSSNLNIFRNSILKFITPSANSQSSKAVEFITGLRPVQSYLPEH